MEHCTKWHGQPIKTDATENTRKETKIRDVVLLLELGGKWHGELRCSPKSVKGRALQVGRARQQCGNASHTCRSAVQDSSVETLCTPAGWLCKTAVWKPFAHLQVGCARQQCGNVSHTCSRPCKTAVWKRFTHLNWISESY